MRGGFYIRLAKDGIVKNRKLYFPYILTCICMTMMYYILYYLGFCADFTKVRGGEMLQALLSLGVWVIAIFSLIFLYYTNSAGGRKNSDFTISWAWASATWCGSLPGKMS